MHTFFNSLLGFEGPFPGGKPRNEVIRGKHQFMKNGALKIRIPNPHQSDIDTSLLKRILRQAEIGEDDWNRV